MLKYTTYLMYMIYIVAVCLLLGIAPSQWRQRRMRQRLVSLSPDLYQVTHDTLLNQSLQLRKKLLKSSSMKMSTKQAPLQAGKFKS